MILGIGTDLVQIQRIEQAITRYEARFIQRIFTQAEQKVCSTHKINFSCFAKRFAAKEAVVKALGRGMREGIWFTDIEVLNDSVGKPTINLTGEAERRLHVMLKEHMLSVANMHLSLSDEGGFAN